jgi:hypothetical protein
LGKNGKKINKNLTRLSADAIRKDPTPTIKGARHLSETTQLPKPAAKKTPVIDIVLRRVHQKITT